MRRKTKAKTQQRNKTTFAGNRAYATNSILGKVHLQYIDLLTYPTLPLPTAEEAELDSETEVYSVALRIDLSRVFLGYI